MSRSMTVKDVMDTWILQMGYPVVSVRRKPGTQHLLLTQQRFLLTKDSAQEDGGQGAGGGASSSSKSPFNYMWKIPITYRTKKNPAKKQVWLNDKEMTLPVTVGEKDDWILFNLDKKGFYRVNYEDSMWKQLIQQLKADPTAFSSADRSSLLDDAFALARAGDLSYDIVFELLGYLSKEQEYVPLKTAMSDYSYLMGRMSLTDIFPKLQKYMLNLTSGQLASLGWTQQSEPLKEYLQIALLSAAISYDDKKVIEEAKQKFQALDSLPTNLRGLVYDLAVKYGDDEVWLAMFRNYTTTTVPTQRSQFLTALTYTDDPRRVQLFLRDSLNGSIVRSQDTGRVITYLSHSDMGQLFAWRFLQKNWDTFYTRYGDTAFTLGNVLKGVISAFNTQFDYDEVTSFFKGKKLGAGRLGLKQSLEMVKSHINWMSRSEAPITQWLNAHL